MITISTIVLFLAGLGILLFVLAIVCAIVVAKSLVQDTEYFFGAVIAFFVVLALLVVDLYLLVQTLNLI